MRVRREAHSACAARSGLLLTAARTASSNCALCSCCRLVPQCIPRPQGRRRRGLRGEREVVSLKILDAKEDLQRQFQTRDLDGFGCGGLTVAIAAAGALLSYAKDTQRSDLPHIRAIHLESQSGAVILDAATRRNLEIDLTLSGGEEHTLYAVYDSTAVLS